MKRRPKHPPIGPRIGILFLEIPPVLDEEFDDTNELVIEEPPIFATRPCGARLHRLDYEPEDD